jgi:serine/threonine protein kinase
MSLREKRKRTSNSTVEKISTKSSKRLKTGYGSYFGDVVFLMVFQKIYFTQKSIEECAQFILESVVHGGYSHLLNLYIAIGSYKLENVDEKQFLVSIFIMLMNTYVHYVIEHKKSGKIRCVFRGQEWDVHIIGSKIENGNHIFFSEMFEIVLVDDKDTIRYVATLRKDIRLHEVESGKVSFIPSDDTSHPPDILGGGSYGFAFKIMGVDGKWYVVKVFDNKKHAEHEWSALKIVMGKHQCLQQGIALQTEREGDIQHIIVSCYQGDIVLSNIRNSPYRFSIQTIITMFIMLLDGIDIAHGCGILHCDIKPKNIIIEKSEDGKFRLVLIDFGIAQNRDKIVKDPKSHFTEWYRIPELMCANVLRSIMGSFMEPLTLSPCADWWAFFISILHVISPPSSDFLGFRSRTESDIVDDMILNSRSSQLMLMMKEILQKHGQNMGLVREIYFVLLKKEGPEKFVEILNRFGIKTLTAEIYEKYIVFFEILRRENPMIERIKAVFNKVVCKDSSVDISGPMNKLINLFVEILCDGSDLSLLGCLTIDHIQKWVYDLENYMNELNKVPKIFFY